MTDILYSTTQNIRPTNAQYDSFQKMYEYFNARLFANQLPDVILSFSRDNERVIAVFRKARWYCLDKSFSDPAGAKVLLHEIALNPRTLRADDQKLMCSDIVHEMCHAWQFEYGKPGRNGYHNKEWAAKMIEVGLQPYNLRNPEICTGDSVGDTIIAGEGLKKLMMQFLRSFCCRLTVLRRCGRKGLRG